LSFALLGLSGRTGFAAIRVKGFRKQISPTKIKMGGYFGGIYLPGVPSPPCNPTAGTRGLQPATPNSPFLFIRKDKHFSGKIRVQHFFAVIAAQNSLLPDK